MEKTRYLNYIPPEAPHVDWTDEQLFDEVDFIATHRIEIRATGERDEQLKERMRKAVGEQGIRYWVRKNNEENMAWAEHGSESASLVLE